MEINKPKGNAPDFKADGVAVWVNTDRNGKQYLKIKLAGHETLTAFKNEPTPKEQETFYNTT